MTDRQLQIPPHITEDAEAMPFERILLAARLIRQLEPEDRRWVVRALATALVDIEPDAMREIVTKLLHPAPDTGAALDAPKEAQRRRETTGH